MICWNTRDGQAYRAGVTLPGGPDSGATVASWEHVPGHQPAMTVDEWHECDEMLRQHPRLIAALAARGITDLSRVLTDVWAYGAALVPPQFAGRRIGWSDVWYRSSADGNPYAHSLTGLHPVVDLNSMELLELEDNGDGDRPDVMGEYLPGLIPVPLREVSPLEVRQPDGVSFSLEGRLLRWQNWQLRIGFNHREGMVRCTPSAFTTTVEAAADRLPDVVRRDGRAVPRLVLRPLPTDRLRHRRMGARLHGDLARAGL